MLFRRIGIVGLPGSGKTSLAAALSSYQVGKTSLRMPLLVGDMVLPQNIVLLCRCLSCYVVEHICLSQLMVCQPDILLDAIILLDISESNCRIRIRNRLNHVVTPDLNFRQLWDDILKATAILQERGVQVFRLSEDEEQFIRDNDMQGEELLRYVFDSSNFLYVLH